MCPVQTLGHTPRSRCHGSVSGVLWVFVYVSGSIRLLEVDLVSTDLV